jgi:hypothetical protein
MLSERDAGVCPFCRFQNEDGALFCDRCADAPPIEVLPAVPISAWGEWVISPLPSQPARRDKKQRWGLWCPYCLFRNEEESIFCERCTSDLSSVAPSRR